MLNTQLKSYLEMTENPRNTTGRSLGEASSLNRIKRGRYRLQSMKIVVKWGSEVESGMKASIRPR